MLYEALGGGLPFRGTLWQVLQDKQWHDPPPLPVTAVPPDLAALCMELLARDPQQRPDAFAITKAIASNVQAVAPVTAPGDRHLVGREQQLAALREAARLLQRQREPLTVFISGRSGEGKTTLAEHFLTPLRGEPSLAVMSGRCYDRESVPFKALDSLIDALSSFLRSLPTDEAALLMPDDIGVLAQVFPVLQRAEVVARAADPRLGTLDEQQMRGRAFRALRALLSRVCRRSLVIWFIDDLQWGDADSAEALFEVLRPPEAPGVLFLGTFRSDETEGSAFLKMWQELQRNHGVQFADRKIKVGPLTTQECTELVIEMVGKDNEVVRRRAGEFAQETRGNPFLLIELIGCFDPDSDSFEPMPLHEVLRKKLGRLPEEAGHLLEVVAVAGHAMALEEAARTAGHEAPSLPTITRMRNERLVRLIGPENSALQVDTYHDRVRETVLAQMEEGKCRTIHRALAEVIEKDVGGVATERVEALESGVGRRTDEQKPIPRIFDLAYHWDAAGEKRRACIHGLLAAEQARRQSALEVALNHYALAKRNGADTTNAVRYRIAAGYGDVLGLRGRYEEANEQLIGVIGLVDDAEAKARIEALQGEIAQKQGQLDKSIVCCQQGLRRLGVWVPTSRLGWAYGLLREVVTQCRHSLLPFLNHRNCASSRADLITKLFAQLTNSYAFQNTVKAVWAHLAGMNRAELAPPCPELAINYGHHATVWSMIAGWPARQECYANRSMILANEFNDLLAHGHSYNFQGVSFFAPGHYQPAFMRLNEAIGAFEKAGDQWLLNLAHFHRGYCHFRLGNFAEAIKEAQWTFTASARLGDSRMLCSSYLWAKATGGNLPFEELKSCLPCRPDDVMSMVHGVLAEGNWHSYHGRTEQALQAFERAAGLVRSSFCLNFHTIAVLPALVGGLRLRADALRQQDAIQSEQLRRRAYRLAKWTTRVTRFFPTAYPHALRERSLVLAASGETSKALQFADKSCAVAQAQMDKYEHAQSLPVRDQLAKQLDLPDAREQVRVAEADLIPAIPAVRRSSLVSTVAVGVVALVAAVVLGTLLGGCAAYVVSFLVPAITDDPLAWQPGTGLAVAVGWAACPMLLVGWALVNWVQRHHEAEIKRHPRNKPNPPPLVIRYALLGLFGVLALSVAMVPAALGIWLGGAVASSIGTDAGSLTRVLPALGGSLCLALPIVLWRLAK